MSKNAVYRAYEHFDILNDQALKQVALGFDTVFISQPPFFPYVEPEEYIGKTSKIKDWVKEVDALIQYLFDQDVIRFITVAPKRFQDNADKHELALLLKVNENIARGIELERQLEQVHDETSEKFLESVNEPWLNVTDNYSRLAAIQLRKNQSDEFYPILRSNESFVDEGRKTEVIRMVLGNIPRPDVDTPWEAIVDFRQDQETRLRYLAVINWINEMSHSAFSVNEISEKLEFLLEQYKQSIERHRLKWKVGTIEILSAAAVGFFTGNLPAAINLISGVTKIGMTMLNLWDDEGKLPGKEIAYIYHFNDLF